MSRYIDADKAIKAIEDLPKAYNGWPDTYDKAYIIGTLEEVPTADVIPKAYYEKVVEELCRKHTEEIASMPTIVRCSECKKSHIDGKTTHYLWCTEWGRSTDTFGYCERADRKE